MSESTNEINLLGSCGLYCRACPRYRVTLEDGAYILELQQGGNYQDYHCLGCHSQKLSEFCQSCTIRLCAKEKGFHHCGLCPDFPCAELKAFAEFGAKYDGARHRRPVVDNLRRVNQIGEQAWLKEQDQRWRCSCGFIFSGYEVMCQVCGEKLDSFANSPSVEGENL
jgi:hypothetical protein